MAALLTVALLAGDPWTPADTAWQTSLTALKVVDWGQTLDIAAQCGAGQFHEMNPILSRCPSRNAVHAYFAVSTAGHAVVAYLLPQPYRRVWQTVWVGIQGTNAWWNYRAGIQVAF